MTAKTKIILAIIVCLLLNSSAALGCIELPDGTTAVAVRTGVFELVSLVCLPFTIVQGLSSDVPLFPQYKQPAGKKSIPKKTAQSGNDSIAVEGSGIIMKLCSGTACCSIAAADIARIAVPGMVASAMNSPGGPPGVIPLIFLAYLVILLKSNLPWKGVPCPARQPGRAYARRGFFIYYER